MARVRPSQASNRRCRSRCQPLSSWSSATSRASPPVMVMARRILGQDGVTQTTLSPGSTMACATSITAFMPAQVAAMRSSSSRTPQRRS